MIVGIIGLGTMGRNAALNVRRAGFEMVVFDIRPQSIDALTAVGAPGTVDPDAT